MILASVNRQHILPLLLFIIVLFVSFCWYQKDTDSYSSALKKIFAQDKEVQNETTVAEKTPAPKETLVLVWNWPWGQSFALDKCQTHYGITGCKLTANRNLYSSADAVIIHHADIMHNKNSLPQQPRPHFQRWVWNNFEPPLIISNLDMLDNLFNMTMTFRHDSDIFIPSGQMQTLKEPQNFTIPKKSKLVSWVVSKWYPGVPRISYYEELKKHISIDVYGARHKPLRKEDFKATISQYKFYLAFENSIYKDYITEKIWSNAFGSEAVPVVLGTSRKNYEQFIPGDAFIHVDDFQSPKDLAAYLLELDKDNDKYQQYFNWRTRYYVKLVESWSYSYCKACAVLKESPRYQVIQEIAKWFLKDMQC